MTQEQIDRVLPLYRNAHFHQMEVWGGAVPDSVMRYLGESPWDRLEKIKTAIGNVSKLTALSRGRNLFGYNPYPDEIIEGFNRRAIESGIDIMRIFDALNDLDNMKYTIEVVRKNGGQTDCAICFTVDPKLSFFKRLQYRLAGNRIPSKIFGIDYFVNKAKELENLKADYITIKDMAGLIDPKMTGQLIRALKNDTALPIDLHTHCSPGYGLASALMSMINDVDILDTVIMNFSGGPAAPAFEFIAIFAKKLGIDIDVDVDAVCKINRELGIIRKELSQFDSTKIFPKEFHVGKDVLPKNIEFLFDSAIEAASKNRIGELLIHAHAIEDYFNFPKPNELIKNAQIPGGMYTNMLAQLQAQGMSDLLDTVLKHVPAVRLDSGCPPLVTPTSQIVGVQAVNNVFDQSKGKPPYSSVTKQFNQLVQGGYGKTPVPINPEFRKKITGTAEEIPYDTTNYERQENPLLPEFGENVRLAKDEKEELLLELFPHVAITYLKQCRENEFNQIHQSLIDSEDQINYERHAALVEGLLGDYQSSEYAE